MGAKVVLYVYYIITFSLIVSVKFIITIKTIQQRKMGMEFKVFSCMI